MRSQSGPIMVIDRSTFKKEKMVNKFNANFVLIILMRQKFLQNKVTQYSTIMKL